MQHRLTTDFHQKSTPHLLPCPNGVIDLRTGALLPKAVPGDFFTAACATEYHPETDIGPAQRFFDNIFPPDAYEEQAALVRCLQQWLGYCLTLDTILQLCMWLSGEGSNGKSILIEAVAMVMGDAIHAQIPMASLCKGRGVNNDALHDARRARHVTVSESDKSTKISEAAFRSLVSGEKQHFKTMWKKEAKCDVHMKLTFAVNTLPEWDDGSAYCTTRRNIYIPLKKVYIDMESAAGMKLAAEHREKGLPESLIAQKDPCYFANAVKGNEPAFLRFMVLGAMEYYKNRTIEIPASLHAHQLAELSDTAGAVCDYVTDFLEIAEGTRTLQRDIIAHFKTTTAIGDMSFKCNDFIATLQKAIKDKGSDWASAKKYDGRASNGEKGMVWGNVGFAGAGTSVAGTPMV
jgi:P4 family phage/plasmid primase-like protien